jgi:hypothetical protein
VPQVTVPPQPLGSVPQFSPAHADIIEIGVQPHTLAEPGLPPPHV